MNGCAPKAFAGLFTPSPTVVEADLTTPTTASTERSGVLVLAIRENLGLLTWQKETFALAESYDEATGRYLGLRGGQNVAVSEDSPFGLLVKPDIARKQSAQPCLFQRLPARLLPQVQHPPPVAQWPHSRRSPPKRPNRSVCTAPSRSIRSVSGVMPEKSPRR